MNTPAVNIPELFTLRMTPEEVAATRTVNRVLLWDQNLRDKSLEDYDWQANRNLVVWRVVERGWPRDWVAIYNLYGEAGVLDAIKKIPLLGKRDISFLTKFFDIPKSELACCNREPWRPPYWLD
jgi:hypothetical protein